MTPAHLLFRLLSPCRSIELIGSAIPLLLIVVLAVPASAQDADSGQAVDIWAGVEEMVVSGSTAGGILADVARSNSVTAFDSADLEAIGASDISDIANFTPNLEIVTAGATAPTFFIRGIGLNDFSANAAGAVAVYTDDVPLNSPALQLGSLFDIENAAVLRGPQGTGPFRNASAGSIKVYSKKPTGEFGATLKASFGNYNARDFEGSIQFPITEETVWARIAFRSVTREGTFKNRCGNAPPFASRLPQQTFCGERPVGSTVSNPRGISLVQEGAPKWLNSQNNWAIRGVFLIQPNLPGDFDMDWLVTFRGSRRDEPSFVGQSIGTSGTSFFVNPALDDRLAVNNPLNYLASPIIGQFGANDDGGFQDPDIAKEIEFERLKLRAICAPCTVGERRDAKERARRNVALDLARDLDSRPHVGAVNSAGGTTNDTFGFSLKGTIEIGDTLELLSITGYDQWQRDVDTDLDFTPHERFEFRTADDGYQIYQELRLTGQAFDSLDEIFGGPLDWEIGAFLFQEKLDVAITSRLPVPTSLIPKFRTYTQTIQTYAAYATLSWDLWDSFTIDGGVRYNYEIRDMDYVLDTVGADTVTDQHLIGEEPTGTIRITWRPNEESSLYMKYTHGFKSGTFNATGSSRLRVQTATPEYIDAFEVGLQGSYFEDRLKLVLGLFHYAYQDFQLFTSIDEFRAPPQFVTLNASDVEMFGAEVEATYFPWEGGLFDLKFAWLEGQFIDYVQTQVKVKSIPPIVQTIPVETNFSGNRLLNAPRFSVTMTVQQAFPLGRYGSMVARWDGTWKDTTYFDASQGRGLPNQDDIFFLPQDTIGQEAFWLHNLRLAYYTPDETIEVALWVRNVENRTYKAFAADLTSFQKTTLFFVGDPRTFGVSTSIKF